MVKLLVGCIYLLTYRQIWRCSSGNLRFWVICNFRWLNAFPALWSSHLRGRWWLLRLPASLSTSLLFERPRHFLRWSFVIIWFFFIVITFFFFWWFTLLLLPSRWFTTPFCRFPPRASSWSLVLGFLFRLFFIGRFFLSLSFCST